MPSPVPGKWSIALCLALAFSAASAGPIETHVIDGDTIKIGAITYRLLGIDAPEAGQKCAKSGGGSWVCGKIATKRMESLVLSGEIRCTSHGEDDYGRVLAVCNAAGQDINAVMVTEGLAWAFRKYSDA